MSTTWPWACNEKSCTSLRHLLELGVVLRKYVASLHVRYVRLFIRLTSETCRTLRLGTRLERGNNCQTCIQTDQKGSHDRSPPGTAAPLPRLRLRDARHGRVRSRGAAVNLARRAPLAGHTGGSATDRLARHGGAAAHGTRGQARVVRDAARGLEVGDALVRGEEGVATA